MRRSSHFSLPGRVWCPLFKWAFGPFGRVFGICGGNCKAQSCLPSAIGARGDADTEAAGCRCGGCASDFPCSANSLGLLPRKWVFTGVLRLSITDEIAPSAQPEALAQSYGIISERSADAMRLRQHRYPSLPLAHSSDPKTRRFGCRVSCLARLPAT